MGNGLFGFLGRTQDFFPPLVFLFKPGTNPVHLPFVSGLVVAGSAASDVTALFGARTQRDMNVKMGGVMMQSVGVANRVARMKSLREFPHDLLHRGMQYLVGIDAGRNQRVVLFGRHGEDQPMCHHWSFRL